MIYYLISEENEYRIFFVKESNSACFAQQCADKILLHACNISALLSLFNNKKDNAYFFSEN
jgi:hypothetical protein